MLRRTLALGSLPFLLLLLATACSDNLGPTAGQLTPRKGADDPPGDNRGIDTRRGADDPAGDDRGVDPKPHFRRGADDPAGDNRGVDLING